jgi:hypothetical protein
MIDKPEPSAQLMRSVTTRKRAPDQSRPGPQFAMNAKPESGSAQSSYHQHNGTFRPKPPPVMKVSFATRVFGLRRRHYEQSRLKNDGLGRYG